MDDAAQAKRPQNDGPFLPDPLEGYMLAMRHGAVELACVIWPDKISHDGYVAAMAKKLRDQVLAATSQTQPKED